MKKLPILTVVAGGVLAISLIALPGNASPSNDHPVCLTTSEQSGFTTICLGGWKAVPGNTYPLITFYQHGKPVTSLTIDDVIFLHDQESKR